MKYILISICLLFHNVTTCQTDWIFPFQENDLFGYTNSCGDTITQAIFQEARETYGGLAKVKYKGKYGFVDNSGKIVIKAKYLDADDFFQGAASVTNKRGKKLAIKPDGSRFKGFREIHGAHRVCLNPCLNERYIIRSNGKYGFVMDKYERTAEGKLFTIPDTLYPKFDTIVPIADQLMYVSQNDKLAFAFDGSFGAGAEHIDTSLKFEYDEIVTFPCPFVPKMIYEILAVRKDNLWGFVRIHNITPIVTCHAKYLSIRADHPKGLALVEYRQGKFGYVNPRSGEEYFCE